MANNGDELEDFGPDDLPPGSADATSGGEKPPEVGTMASASEMDRFGAAHPGRAEETTRAALVEAIDRDDPSWILERTARDVEAAADRAVEAADRAADLLKAATETLSRVGKGMAEVVQVAIPAAVRAGAQSAGDDIRGQVGVAITDGTKAISQQIAASVAQSAPVAARQILRAVAPGIRDAAQEAAQGPSRAGWMLTGLLILLAGLTVGAAGAYLIAPEPRLPPGVRMVRSGGHAAWTISGAILRPGQAWCPPRASFCSEPAR